jgi:hypothetical protein
VFLQTGDSLQVVTAAAGQVDCALISYADVTGTGSSATVDVSRSANVRITTATTTSMLTGPASGTKRKVKFFRITNTGVAAQRVQLHHNDGSLALALVDTTLAIGESIAYNDEVGLRVLGANGVNRTSTGGALPVGFGASVTANAADTYVAGFPIAGRLQQFSAVHWRISVSKTGAGTAAPVFTIRTGTAGAVGDTARITLTSPFAQTGVTDSGNIDMVATVRTYGSSGVLVASYQLGHALAATGLATQPSYGQSVTSAAFDLTTAGLILGLSINPGTAGVWTIDCAGMATNLIA